MEHRRSYRPLMLHLLFHCLGQLALVLLLLGAACGFGTVLLTALGLGEIDRLERWLFAAALGMGALSPVLLTLGALGLYYPVVAWALVVLGLALLLLRVRLFAILGKPAMLAWRSIVDRRSSFAEAVRASGDRRRTPAAYLVALPIALIVLLALGYALLANALTPPVSYDVVAYHFAIPKLYLAAHRIVYIPYIVHSNWPLGAEMLYTLSLLLGSEQLAQLITWAFAALAGAGLVAFGRRWLPPWTGPLAAALFFSIPMVPMLAGTGLVEVPLACYSLLAFYAYWRWRETDSGSWLVASALLSGCAAAIKLNAAAVAIVLAGLTLLSELLARRPAHAVRMAAVYGLASLLVVAPWYLKAWIHTGNPIWPFLHPLLGGRNWDAIGTEYLIDFIKAPNLAPSFRNWALGLWFVSTDPAARFGSYRLGPYLIALLPIAALPAITDRRMRPLLGALALAGLGLYTIWFLLTHQTRFLMPAVPLLALLAAAGVAWLGQQLPTPLGWAARLAVVAWLLAGAWIFSPERRAELALRWPYLSGQRDRDAYLASVFDDYPAFRYANQHLPLDALVLLAPYEARGYYLDRPYIWMNPIGQRLLRLEQFPNVEAFGAELRRLGVTHMLVNTRYVFTNLRYWQHDEQLMNGIIAAHGRLLFESAQSRLYALDLRAGAGAPR